MKHTNHNKSSIAVRDSKWNQLWTEWLRKVCAIILNHRIASFQNDHQHRRKSSTWFNINVKENERANSELDSIIRRHRRSSGGISMQQQQRQLHQQQQQQQREVISIYLDIFIDNLHRPSTLTNRQRSVSAAANNPPDGHNDRDEQRAAEKSKHAKVLLERWHLHVITAGDGTNATGQKFNEAKLHTSYKKSTVMMRSLLSFVVLMPCFQLFEKKRRSMDSVKHLSNIRYALYEDITRSTSIFEQGSTSKFIFSPIELSDHHSIELDVQYRSNLKSVMMMDRDNISEMKRQGLRSHQIIFDFFDGADNKKPDERQSTSVQQRVSRRRSIKSQLRMTEDNNTPASFSPLLQDDDEDAFTRRQRSMSSPSPYHQRPPLHSNTGTSPISSQQKQHQYQEQQKQSHHPQVTRSPSISTEGDEQSAPKSLLTQQLLQHSKQQQQYIPHTSNDEQNSTTTQESDSNRQSNEQKYTHPLQLPSSVSPSTFGSIPIARSNSSTYSISPPPFKDLVDSGSSSWKRKFNIRFSPIIDSPLNSYHLPVGYHYPNTPRESFYDGDELIPDDDSDDEQMESVESGEPSSYFQDPSRLVPSIFVKDGRESTGEDEQSQKVQETESDYSRSIVSQYQIPSFLIYDDQRDTSKFSGSSDSHTRTDSANIDDEDALMLMMMGEHSGYSSGNANKLLFEMDEASGDDTSALVPLNKKPQQRRHFKSLLTELEDAKLKFFAHENRDKITRSVSDIIRESDDWIAKKTELLNFHAK